MDDRAAVMRVAGAVAEAIGRKDAAAVRQMLAVGFVQRSLGGSSSETEAFLDGVASIPGEVLTIRLEQLEVDVTPVGAVATGIQFAQVHVHGQLIDDRRGFVDWFVRDGGNGGCRPPSTSRRRHLKKTNQVETVLTSAPAEAHSVESRRPR